MTDCFHCFSNGSELVKQQIHSTFGSLLIASSLIDDGRLRALSKCSAHLFKIASLSVRRLVPSALRRGVVPELWGHKLSLWHQRTSSYPSFLSAKDWISSALLLSQESCISLSLVWTVLHIFEYATLLDTELVSLKYALCFWCFFSSFSSNQSWCLRDTGPRESIAEEWMVSLKTVQFSSGSSERSPLHLIDCRYH